MALRQKSKQNHLDFLENVAVIIADGDENCIHIIESNGASVKVIISDNPKITGRSLHYNETFLVVALSDANSKGGYFVGWRHDLTKKLGLAVQIPLCVSSIHISNENKVVLGASNGIVQLHQLDMNGRQKMIWDKKPHSACINEVAMRQDKIFTASQDKRYGVINLSDGLVLHMTNPSQVMWSICVVKDDDLLMGYIDAKAYYINRKTSSVSAFSSLGSLAIGALRQSVNPDIVYCGGLDQTLYAVDLNTKATLWKTECEYWVSSIWELDGLVVASVSGRHFICVDSVSGELISTFNIKPSGNSCIVMPRAMKPIAPSIDLHQTCQEQIQKLTQERNSANQRFSQLHQQFETFKLQANQQQQQLNQQIINLKADLSKLKEQQARDQMNALIANIDTVSGPQMLQIAGILNIDVTDINASKLEAGNLLAHDSFDEFFEELDVSLKSHDSLLRLYSVIKKAKEIGQLPVEQAIAPWIAKQGQPEIAAHFAKLDYTEEMLIHLNPTVFAHRFEIRPSVIKKLQADFIISQTSIPRLGSHFPQQSAIASGQDEGGVILVPFKADT